MISIIDETGHERFLGNLPGYDTTRMYGWKTFGDTPETPLIKRADWEPLSLRHWMPAIKDQDGIGACNAFATVTVMECQRKIQTGVTPRELSAGWLYGHINGQVDRGSLLEDALAHVTRHGVPYADTIGNLEWKMNQWRGKEAQAEIECKENKVLECYLCPTFDHLASAILSGFSLNLGVLWYGNYNPDSDGWLPSGRGGAGGHSIPGCGLAFRRGNWGIEFNNNWGPQWGRNGGAILPETAFRGPVGGWFAVRQLVSTE